MLPRYSAPPSIRAVVRHTSSNSPAVPSSFINPRSALKGSGMKIPSAPRHSLGGLRERAGPSPAEPEVGVVTELVELGLDRGRFFGQLPVADEAGILVLAQLPPPDPDARTHDRRLQRRVPQVGVAHEDLDR